LTKKIILIDVRTPEEFDEGHLSGAVNVSVTSIDFANQINEFSKKGPIYMFIVVQRKEVIEQPT
jgi:rhodanese-related sulfurtransferase